MPTITGRVGIVKIGYQVAIEIRDWRLKSSQETLGKYNSTLIGKIVSVKTVWARQGPLTMELCLGLSWWIWSNVTLLNPDSLKVGGNVELYTESNPIVK